MNLAMLLESCESGESCPVAPERDRPTVEYTPSTPACSAWRGGRRTKPVLRS